MSGAKILGGCLSIAAGIFILIASFQILPALHLLHSIMGWLLHVIFAIIAILGGFFAFRKSRNGGWLILSAGIFTTTFAIIYNFILLPIFLPYSFFIMLTDILDLSIHLWIFGIPIEAVILLFGAIIILFSEKE